MKTVLITGASSGIGLATAQEFLNRGYQVVAVVRQSQSLNKLAEQFGSQLKLISCDLFNFKQIENLSTQLNDLNIRQIDVLVNNAGQAVAGPFSEQNFQEIETTIQLNVVALMKVTQVLIPYLIQSAGRIINISSVSGKQGTPFLAAYCASKHAIEGFSESLRRELNIYGVRVCLVGPGSVKTPIWTKGFVDIKERYAQSDYAESFARFIQFAAEESSQALEPIEVVKDIIHAAESKCPKIRYAPIPRKWKNWYLPQLFPLTIMDRLVIMILGLKRRSKC